MLRGWPGLVQQDINVWESYSFINTLDMRTLALLPCEVPILAIQRAADNSVHWETQGRPRTLHTLTMGPTA